MKKNFYLFSAVLVIGIFVFVGNVKAAPLPIPSPALVGVVGTDLDDSGIFIHSNSVISIELFDFGDAFGSPLFGSTFGFYFEGTDVTNDANLHTIFDVNDNPATPFPSQGATIDFGLGLVFDVDENVVQTVFTGSGNIGFWLSPDPEAAPPNPDPVLFFTQASLNQGSLDVSGTYPILGAPDDDFLISFAVDTNGDGTNEILALEIVNGVQPIPEPSTIFLLGSGLIGLALYGRKEVRNRCKRNARD